MLMPSVMRANTLAARPTSWCVLRATLRATLNLTFLPLQHSVFNGLEFQRALEIYRAACAACHLELRSQMNTRNRLLVAVGSWVGIAVGAGAESIAPLRLFGRRAADIYKKTGVLVLNAVVCFACLELASASVIKGRVALAALIQPGEQEVLDPRSASSYYSSQEWAPVYWREFRVSRRQAYRPYVLWRRHAFSGKTINVDADGVRLTPGAVCGSSSFKVFVLGGSTVWGTGSADWNTLPAHLQTELQGVSARPVCVVNFGESAYVSTQSVLQLLLQLQAGNVPDLVISYEGYNDAFSAYQSGRAGVHENLAQLAASFEGTKRVEQSAIGRLMRRYILILTDCRPPAQSHASS